MEFRLLTWDDRELWARTLSALPPEKRDIYFSPGYCHAAAGNQDQGKICAWHYSDGGESAIYPFLIAPLRPLGLLHESSDYYDIEGFYGYGGVATSTSDPEFAAGFHRTFNQFCQEQRIAVELTRFHPLLNNQQFSAGQLEVLYIQDTVIIDLTNGYDHIWNNAYDAKNRNMIRKSQKNNVSCRLSNDWESFRKLYWKTMDNCGASAGYYFDDNYFNELRTLQPAEGSCLLIEAVWENRVVASQLLMLHGNYAHYHLSARDPEFSHLAGTNLLLDFAIKTAIDSGAVQMHLGGGKMVNDSLMRFKAGFSPLRGQFNLGFKAHNPKIYQQLCDAWSEKNPDKVEKFQNFYLKYRY